MDQFMRRIVGFGVWRGIVDGAALCKMFNRAIRGQAAPNYLSTDNDPLYRDGNQDRPYVPLSHPFVERLTIAYCFLFRRTQEGTWERCGLENDGMAC
jgi:hypothetical protein